MRSTWHWPLSWRRSRGSTETYEVHSFSLATIPTTSTPSGACPPDALTVHRSPLLNRCGECPEYGCAKCTLPDRAARLHRLDVALTEDVYRRIYLAAWEANGDLAEGLRLWAKHNERRGSY